MHAPTLLCLALVATAAARPQGYKNDAVTTVTERSYTIRGEADKYYGTNGLSNGVNSYSNGVNSYSNGLSNGISSFSNGVSDYAAYPYSFPSSYSFPSVAPARSYQPLFQSSAFQAPAFQSSAFQAPAFQSSAFQAPAFQAYQAPAIQTVTAAPAISYSAAPALSLPSAHEVFETATAAPALSFPTATVAPALAFQAATVAPALPALPLVQTVSAPVVALRQQDYNTEAKIYKHVYAFAAPEEPATRTLVRVEAPVSKRKHYKLVFIKAPSQQTVVDSDITLPAQEEEKTLIYVLSKEGKQHQPEVRIKQAESSKHNKPEVFFLKYKNEAEAQAIASSTISGQNADVPAEGEIISDGSVSVLGQGGDSSLSSGFQSSSSNYEAPIVESAYRSNSAVPALFYRSSQPAARISTVSTGSVGIVPVTQAPISIVSDARDSGFAGYSGGFAFGRSLENEAPINIKVTSEPSNLVQTSTASTLAL